MGGVGEGATGVRGRASEHVRRGAHGYPSAEKWVEGSHEWGSHGGHMGVTWEVRAAVMLAVD